MLQTNNVAEDTQQHEVSTQIIIQNTNIHCIQNTNKSINACYKNMNASWGFTSYVRRLKQAQQSPYNNFITPDDDHMMVETCSDNAVFKTSLKDIMYV
jgi:hypothetical protein